MKRAQIIDMVMDYMFRKYLSTKINKKSIMMSYNAYYNTILLKS